jgi:hypothetical protein
MSLQNLHHSDTCTVTQVDNNRSVEAEVQDFRPQDRLVVVVNRAVKLHLKWNGRVYEGRAAGMDFVSDGPRITRTQTSIRG